MKKSIRFAFLATIMAILMGITALGVGCGPTENVDPPEPEEPNPHIELMTFELNEDGNTYTFKALDRSAEGDVKIPGKYEGKTVTKIANDACVGNEAITSLVISEGITVIEDNAFKNCKGMESVTFPDTLTSIEAYAFNWCTKLTSITFPKNLKKIGEHAFDTASNITSLTFNEGLTEIGDRAFNYLKATSLRLPDSLTKIGWRAFLYMKQLKTLSIGNNVTSIGDQAFSYMDRLEQLEFRGTRAQWDAISIDQTKSSLGLDYLTSKEIESKSYTLKFTDSTYKVYPRQNNTDSERVEEKIA